jgi:hypothetical protein
VLILTENVVGEVVPSRLTAQRESDGGAIGLKVVHDIS